METIDRPGNAWRAVSSSFILTYCTLRSVSLAVPDGFISFSQLASRLRQPFSLFLCVSSAFFEVQHKASCPQYRVKQMKRQCQIDSSRAVLDAHHGSCLKTVLKRQALTIEVLGSVRKFPAIQRPTPKSILHWRVAGKAILRDRKPQARLSRLSRLSNQTPCAS